MNKLKNLLSGLKRGLASVWKWYIGQFKGRPWWRKVVAALVSLVVFVVFYCLAVIFNLFWLFGKTPSVNDIMHPRNAEASLIYSADGKELGKYFSENRSPVPYDSISPLFIQTLISTEDERFYQHHGVDFQGLAAAAKDAVRGDARGASTITQQLVKNMFKVRTEYSTGLLGRIPGLGILIKKSKEMIIAVELEMLNSKEDILRMYCNTVDFGSNAYGIKTAAKTYFGTTPSALKAEEAAVLVGLLKATTTYNPRINPKNSLRRRNTVLDNLCSHGHITRAACDSLKALPIRLNFNVESAYDGTALYFRQAVADYIKKNCPELDPYSDGLKIYTTLDSRMQQYAEQAVRDGMRRVQQNFDQHWRGLGDPWRDESGKLIPHFIEDIARRSEAYKLLAARYPNHPDSVWHYMNRPHRVKLFGYDGEQEREMSTLDSIRFMVKFLHTGFVAMEPQTGCVRAYVGDVDFHFWKYDKVQAMRQPGSTFKLFVYAEAMNQGLTPSTCRKDEYIQMEVYDARKKANTIWRPHNANGTYSNATIPLYSAFAQSVNTIAVKLGQEVGVDNVARIAHEMGIKSSLDATPSLPLGASDVNLFELVNAYATVANNGVQVEPVLVTKILDRDGNVVYEAKEQSHRALSYRSAFYMQKLLEAGVLQGGGTSQTFGSMAYLGKYIFSKQLDAGGKTGTSNNHSDAWFVGVTPALVGGAWVGGEYRSIHFRTGRLGQGSRTALPIVAAFMRKVLDDPSLQSRYLKRYEQLEKIDPASYQGNYVFQTPADTLESDSTDVETANLMEDGEPAADAADGKSAAEPTQSQGAEGGGGENLFE